MRCTVKTLVLTGGGTAGHVIPCLALLPELKKHYSVVYMGTNGIEKKLANEAGIPFYEITAVKFDRKNLLADCAIPFRLNKGVAEAKKILRSLRPVAVFSKGGYVSLPACFAAKTLHVPVICHESDYTMGLANRLVAPFAALVLTSFPETKGGVFVGNPVREEFFSASKFRALFSVRCRPNKKTVLIVGGSQGSKVINAAVFAALPTLTEKYNVVHIVGNAPDPSFPNTDGYTRFSYASDYPDLLALSDVLVCRAGANTLFEAAAVGKPCVTVPLPKGTSRGDQILNAKSFEKRHSVLVLPQEELSERTLISSIEKALSSTPRPFPTQANRDIVERIVKTVGV